MIELGGCRVLYGSSLLTLYRRLLCPRLQLCFFIRCVADSPNNIEGRVGFFLSVGGCCIKEGNAAGERLTATVAVERRHR